MKTVEEFLAEWKVFGDSQEFMDELEDFLREASMSGCVSNLQVAKEIVELRRELRQERARLNWLLPRQHTHTTRESIDKEL